MEYSARIDRINVVRFKQLKGGRVIIRNHRTLKCNAPIIPDENGVAKVRINTSQFEVTMSGTMKGEIINMTATSPLIVKTKFLKKGFKTVMAYGLRTNKTNTGH
ncbi:hypothetical protein ST201phi2-1p309 [Pseudomonas phage 201phi2-1]|uniref:Uncharacterized protein n=1 Tax=Pseudomonas phage 201phi2-1 TaxID=198110 RepID=B3FJG9_BP201|nr:hypothetical protein ST201phi2-1p309 [Pseudomonas phage 201phi2-1]ABY63135.1 hypothetical protein 201phi2-1p309 [Pseudomonas phage 201phi2-1]